MTSTTAPVAAPAATEAISTTRQRLALASVLMATFMGLLDGSIVTVATPSIQADLRASFGEIQFVIAGYTVAYAVGLVTGGRVGDLIGRKRSFVIGVLTFIGMSVLCAIAPTAGMLIAARVLQGLAAAVMLPQVLSIIQVTFTGPARAGAIGIYGATIGLASISGQLVGGALLAANPAGLGWRSLFLINVPIGVAAIVSARATVTESRGGSTRLDLAGASLLGLGLVGLLLPLAIGPAAGWPVWTWAALAAGVLVLAGFAVIQRRLQNTGGAPLVPPRLLAQARFARGLFLVLVFYSGNAGLFLLLAYHLQAGLHFSALGSGAVFAPLGLGFAVASLAGKKLAARYGARVMVAGATLMSLSLAAFVAVVAVAPQQVQALALLPALVVSGIGEGLVAAPLITTVLADVAPADSGAASGVLLTGTQVANALGVAVIGGIFAGVLGSTPDEANTTVAFADYVHATAITGGIVLALAVLTGLVARALRTRH
ncbi:MFS transporter [Amycolatopsis taiwanensis]|uniref:MFS transporter n=1 Tax=Amycolatopsis taiwanensis TaxID=342230 RepID=UPI0004B35AF3|nr:MFS transporter [Amycolatopsis taiwanensis]